MMNQFGSKFIQTCKSCRKQGETRRFTKLILFPNSPIVIVSHSCMVKCNSMPYLTGLIPTLPHWSRNGVALRQADTISFNACISACEGLGVVAVKFVNWLDIFLDMDDGIMNHDSYTLPICCKMANTWSLETIGILQMNVSCEWVRRKFLIRLWVVLWVCEMCIFCRDKRRIH